jgi:ubiquinone/menaquinone biosynthesis C-methylase UbiE
MSYLMENSDEDIRLEIKTDMEAVKRQAAGAGIREGMRVLDVGCGIGKTTAALADLVGPTGLAVGLDFSPDRLNVANEKYARPNVSFKTHNVKEPLLWEEEFDAIWMRFFVEYFRVDALDVIGNVTKPLKCGGLLVMADLDQNSLIHYGQSVRMQRTIEDMAIRLARDFNFDPYAGGRLYGYLYDLGYQEIQVSIEAHHLIYGELTPRDDYNWVRKLELTARQSGCQFEAYADEFISLEDRYEAFRSEFMAFFSSPRRFTYTPLVIASGCKPNR